MKVKFQNEIYQLVFTDHAESRMKLRGISVLEVINILESGKVKAKEKALSFWVYKSLEGRKDKTTCLSVSLEDPFLIVITTLINWRPT